MTKRAALICVHTSPLIPLGGDKAGGMNVYIKESSRALARYGWEVDIFTRAQAEADIQRVDDSLDDRVRVVHIEAGPAKPMGTAAHAAYLDDFTAGVLRYSDETKRCYSLITSHYWLSGLVALKLREAWGVPVVSMFHTLGLMKNRIATSEAEREPEMRIDAETRIMKHTDALIAATPAERIQMMWLYHADMDRIRIIPPGVDLSHFCPLEQDEARREIGIAADDYHLLFVGRLEPLKGLDTLLHALAHLRETRPELGHNIVITIIGGTGDSHEMERLRRTACELGIGDRVSFLGPRSQDALPQFYSAADAVVMPSHYESFGMVALEAMACGTPVIASEVGGLAYLIQDGVTGFRVPSRDHEQLAGKIAVLLKNPGLRAEMGYAAARYATGYGWELIARQLNALYLDVLNESQNTKRPDH